MSDCFVSFGDNILALRYNLDTRLAQWDALRAKMVRGIPTEFTRDEWAYTVSFLAKDHLVSAFTESFGVRADGKATALFRSRGPISIWLPSNVSLLGPLMLVLASFAGAPIRVKVGSKSNDLCVPFLRYAIQYLDKGELCDYLSNAVKIERFDRHDPHNAEMAASASVRIAFGSDAAMMAIHSLPHPVDSIGISFGNHCSEVWVEPATLNDEVVAILLKVFAIYGQAGCTSPRRVVMIGGTLADCEMLRERMLSMWSKTIKQDAPMHIASQNVMHGQLNAACGWDVRMTARNCAVLGVGSIAQPEMSGLMSLAIVSGTEKEAIAMLPHNIQTIGHCLREAASLLPLLARTKVKRFVPVTQMHHFGPIWDGINFWRLLFEEVQIAA